MKNIKKGTLYLNRADNRLYTVVEVINDIVDGFKRNTVTMGNLEDNSTMFVDPQSLTNKHAWTINVNAKLKERLVVEKYVLLDDGEHIVSRSVVNRKNNYVEKPKATTNKEGNVTVVEKQVIVNNRFSEMAKHKQARENKTNVMTDAFAKAKAVEKVVEEVVEEPVKTISTEAYWKMMSFTYDDLVVMGSALKGVNAVHDSAHKKAKGGMALILQQEYDAFKNENMTLGQVRMLGNRKTVKPEFIGKPVSPWRIIQRMYQAIAMYGTQQEKTDLHLV